MDIKLLVAAHKPYPMPEDPMYLPIQVGAEGKEEIAGFCQDNRGDHISGKNDRYCELTGLYFGWKNLSYDALGLVHYRRHFTCKSAWFRHHHDKMDSLLTGEEAEALLLTSDIIVPRKRHYVIESLYSHYGHTLDSAHLDKAREVVAEKYPSYLAALDEVYDRSWGYMFNMFLMKREYVDEYCNWLFTILLELERRIDMSQMSSFEMRLYGRVSEILFNAWLLEKEKSGVRIREIRYLPMESTNWWKKGSSFLAAKFLGKKYKESF